VLLPLDAAAPVREALEAAVGLAARLGAELEATLVEGPDLRRAVGLSSSRHVALAGGAALELGAAAAGLRAVAGRVRADLERAAGREGLRWTLRVLEERAAREAVAGRGGDLVVVARADTWRARPGEPAGSRDPAAGMTSFLVLGPRRRARTAERVWVLWDASAPAQVALDLAQHLTAEGREGPRLLVAATDLGAAERLAGGARSHAGRGGLAWRWAGGTGTGDVLRAFPIDAVLVVAAASPAAGGAEGRRRLLNGAQGPVLLLG
jgi:hypothetical protein